MTHLDYAPLVQRLTELRKAASVPRERGHSESCVGCGGVARQALAAPAHEMAACCEALIEWDAALFKCKARSCQAEGRWHLRRMDDGMVQHLKDALAELAKALGVEVPQP